jgi:hypothetical protein
MLSRGLAYQVCLAFGLLGCARTNAEWLSVPEDDTTCVDGSCDREPPADSPPPAEPLDEQAQFDTPTAPARLGQTVTLGTVTEIPPTAPAGMAGPANTPTVVVNQYQQVVMPAVQVAYPVASYASPLSFGRGAGTRHTSAPQAASRPSSGSPPAVGANWPTVPSYGPAPLQ